MQEAREGHRVAKEPRREPASLVGGYVVPFALIHVGAMAALLRGVSVLGVLLFLAVFMLQGFGITAGYHRYFAHRSFKTSRGFQFVLAVLGTLAVQKGVLWWTAHHRRHHRCADAEGDPHSPRDGVVWSHMGWFLSAQAEATDPAAIGDLTGFPELVWLDRNFVTPPLLLAVGLSAAFGWTGLLWGFCLGTTAAWHLTYAVNSLGHRRGSRRYDTADDSRNSFALALFTFGEGWHNNHHRFPSSSRQGLLWWEIDWTYYALRGLLLSGLVWDLVEPPVSSRNASH